MNLHVKHSVLYLAKYRSILSIIYVYTFKQICIFFNCRYRKLHTGTGVGRAVAVSSLCKSAEKEKIPTLPSGRYSDSDSDSEELDIEWKDFGIDDEK